MASTTLSFDHLLTPLSTPALQILHGEIRRLFLEQNERQPQPAAREAPPVFAAFKVQADTIERILRQRKQPFDAIPW